MLKAVIIDDEQLAIEELKYLLEPYKEIEVIGTFTNSSEGELFIYSHKPDIIFLDIQMPRRTGLEIAKLLLTSSKPMFLIFVTAYDTYAMDAFDVSATDYLLKPITEKRLAFALEKVMRTFKNSSVDNENKDHENHLRSSKFITHYNKGVYEPVKFSDIIYCHSDEGTVSISTPRLTYEYTGNFSVLESVLDHRLFFRCHRSYIVNIEKIEKVEPTERSYLIKLNHSNHLIPVARSHASEFKKIMSIY
jgi:DNA-binding LytR/AlgR family response regulator